MTFGSESPVWLSRRRKTIQIIHDHQQFTNTSKSKELHMRGNLRMDGQTDMRRKRDDFLGLSHKDPLSFAQTIIDIPPTNDRQFFGRAGTGCPRENSIQKDQSITIHAVESSQCFGNLSSPPQTCTATPQRVSQSWLCHNFTAGSKTEGIK